MSRLSSAVADGAQRFGVLLSPRNLLQDETEKETLLHALIELSPPASSRAAPGTPAWSLAACCVARFWAVSPQKRLRPGA